MKGIEITTDGERYWIRKLASPMVGEPAYYTLEELQYLAMQLIQFVKDAEQLKLRQQQKSD